MYSEHLIAAALGATTGRTTMRTFLAAGRTTVSVGRLIGPLIGAHPNDASLIWYARTFGVAAPLGTRGALHVLASGFTALHLGSGRGAVETTGASLVVLTDPPAERYTEAWYLPNVEYGGLI